MSGRACRCRRRHYPAGGVHDPEGEAVQGRRVALPEIKEMYYGN
jgi:hypothetical protein